MPRLVYRAPCAPVLHMEDVRRMNDVLRGEDFFVDLNDINDAWTAHSERQATGWLSPPRDDKDLLDTLLSLLEGE